MTRAEAKSRAAAGDTKVAERMPSMLELEAMPWTDNKEEEEEASLQEEEREARWSRGARAP